jgi:hypothetical protein
MYFNKTSLESFSRIRVYSQSTAILICLDMDSIEAILDGDDERIIVFDYVNELYSLGALDDKLIARDRSFENT